MGYRQKDLKTIVQLFENYNQPTGRYASFDYCYNYFRLSTSDALLYDMERSCLSLSFYLASWGMFRGSSFLIDKSSKHFEPIVEYIASLDRNVWEIDIDKLDENNIKQIIDIYKNIKSGLIPGSNAHLTLVTKVMLGVFGFIPAYDRFFINSFSKIFKGRCGFTSFNKNSLLCIKDFYEDNQDVIDQFSKDLQTFDFKTGKRTLIPYPKCKIIDMYGFEKGLKL